MADSVPYIYTVPQGSEQVDEFQADVEAVADALRLFERTTSLRTYMQKAEVIVAALRVKKLQRDVKAGG